jgi:hypothetical protein
MKKRPAFFDELLIWFRGRFSLTEEEKLWLLILLVICWTGLLGRWIFLQHQTPEPLSREEVRQLTASEK